MRKHQEIVIIKKCCLKKLEYFSILSHFVSFYPVLSHFTPMLSHFVPFCPILSHSVPFVPFCSILFHFVPFCSILSHFFPFFPIFPHFVPICPIVSHFHLPVPVTPVQVSFIYFQSLWTNGLLFLFLLLLLLKLQGFMKFTRCMRLHSLRYWNILMSFKIQKKSKSIYKLSSKSSQKQMLKCLHF